MKRYFIKTRQVELAERMRDKMMYYIEVELQDRLQEGENVLDEMDKLFEHVEELDNAKNNLICEGLFFKGYWKDIETIKKYAKMREILDLQL